MQVIKTDEHTKCFCPMKYNNTPDHMNRCDGPKCMWWCYAEKEIYVEFRSVPTIPEYEDDLTKGYCGR